MHIRPATRTNTQPRHAERTGDPSPHPLGFLYEREQRREMRLIAYCPPGAQSEPRPARPLCGIKICTVAKVLAPEQSRGCARLGRQR